MPILEIEGKSYEVDDEGYLLVPQQWDENFAIHSAKKDGLELTEEHWRIINYQREYFKKYRISRTNELLEKDEDIKAFSPNKNVNKYLWELFNNNPSKQSARYAGMPKPIIT
jgi:tRNA 2-thiouridine synthesizing protein E